MFTVLSLKDEGMSQWVAALETTGLLIQTEGSSLFCQSGLQEALPAFWQLPSQEETTSEDSFQPCRLWCQAGQTALRAEVTHQAPGQIKRQLPRQSLGGAEGTSLCPVV